MAKAHRSSRRYSNGQRIGFYYQKKFRWLETCVYCGQNATCKDHVMPLKVASQLDLTNKYLWEKIKHLMVLVPSCSECNSIAGSEVFENIRDKRSYIQNVLKKKHRKWLRHVEWDQEDIEELGPNMLVEVKKAMKNKLVVTRRVYYPCSENIIRLEKFLESIK